MQELSLISEQDPNKEEAAWSRLGGGGRKNRASREWGVEEKSVTWLPMEKRYKKAKAKRGEKFVGRHHQGASRPRE